MNKDEFKQFQEERILAAYDKVPEHTKEDIEAAIKWAKKTLTNLEGKGHLFYVIANGDRTISCSFAKPEWPGDHCGRGMEHGAEAIVMAVCEYINGA